MQPEDIPAANSYASLRAFLPISTQLQAALTSKVRLPDLQLAVIAEVRVEGTCDRTGNEKRVRRRCLIPGESRCPRDILELHPDAAQPFKAVADDAV